MIKIPIFIGVLRNYNEKILYFNSGFELLSKMKEAIYLTSMINLEFVFTRENCECYPVIFIS